MRRFARFTDSELAGLAGVVGVCECCPRPCCDYCGLEVNWTVTASASKTTGTIVETVAWSIDYTVTYARDDSPTAPTSPPTFKVVDVDSECQLVSNGGSQQQTTDLGSYSYEKRNSGVLIDSEYDDLVAFLDAVDVNVNCDGDSLPDAGGDDPGTVVNTKMQGSDLLGLPSTMPACWSVYGSIGVNYPVDNIDDHSGTYTNTETDECGGWDTSSLTETVTVELTRCV